MAKGETNMYKVTRIDTGTQWRCRTYSEALHKATVMHNKIKAITKKHVRFNVEKE